MKIAAINAVELLFSENKTKYFYILSKKNPAWDLFAHNLPSQKIINIDLRKGGSKSFSDKEIIKHSDIDDQMRSHKIDAFWLYDDSSPLMEKWACSNALKLLAHNYRTQRKFENKIYFENFLQKNKISSPKSRFIHSNDDIREIQKYPVVLQVPFSRGSQGTFLVYSEDDLKNAISARSLKFPLLCREYMHGIPMGVTLLIGKYDVIFSSFRMQAISLKEGRYFGIQWVRSDFFPRDVKEQLAISMTKLASAFRQAGFLGAANIDLILDGSKFYLLECNPRLALSTTQIVNRKELFHGLDFTAELVKALSGQKLSQNLPEFPESDFEGCVLDMDYLTPLLNRRRANNPLKIGVYKPSAVQLAYFSDRISDFSQKDDVFIYNLLTKNRLITLKTDLGLIMTNKPIFQLNREHAFLEDGRKLMDLLKDLFLSIA